MSRTPLDRKKVAYGLQVGIVVAAVIAAIALAEVELGVVGLLALVRLASEFPSGHAGEWEGLL